MEFEKGWSRYGRDQPELTSRASGFYLAPGGGLSLGVGRASLGVTASRAQITFDHSGANTGVETHTGSGYALRVGFTFGIGKGAARD